MPENINQVVNASNQFAIDMYQKISSDTDQAGKNVFFSPYGLSTAMAMLYVGAEGETKNQIAKTFHYPALPVLNMGSSGLMEQLNKPNPNYQLITTNHLWINKELTPNQAYLDTVKRYYGGEVTNLDFANQPDPSRQIMNKAIAKQTEQMIPELLPPKSIQDDTVSVLTNAIYFKGDWKSQFDAKNTRLMLFYTFENSSSKTQMMYQKMDLSYMENDNLQIAQLPYQGNELSMMVVLPKSKDKAALEQIIGKLNVAQMNEWSKHLKPAEVDVYLPKFKLQESYKMKDLLSQMGMPVAFDEGKAEFNLFNTRRRLFLDDVIHKAVVEVDEKGTKAAAATAVVVAVESASMPITFKADHPFMFVIKDNKTGAILFLGQVNKP